MDGEPLPGMPEPPAPKKRRPIPGVRVTRIHGAKGLCEQCCYEIHANGVAVAPYPRLGRWRVTSPEGAARLCDAHKDERLGQ